jgi:flagellar motor switch protein FliN/FliY
LADISGEGTETPAPIRREAVLDATEVHAEHLPDEAELADEPELRRILQLEVPVIVKLAERRMRLSDILGLGSGSIIEFPMSSDAPLDVLVNNVAVGKGEVVKVGENFGLRVCLIGNAEEKILAMGGADVGEFEAPSEQAPSGSDDEDRPETPAIDPDVEDLVSEAVAENGADDDDELDEPADDDTDAANASAESEPVESEAANPTSQT